MGGRKRLQTDVTRRAAGKTAAVKAAVAGASGARLTRALLRLGFRALLALPAGLLLRLAGERPRVVDGRQLDPRVQFHAWFVRHFRKPLEVTPAELRKPRLLSLFLLDGGFARVDVEDGRIAGPGGSLSTRIYRPHGLSAPPPVLVFFHFGGCVLGDLDTCHNFCSRLSREAGVMIVSAQYRLAPEHKFPAAVDDAIAAFRWAREHAASLGGDPQQVGIGGDSAGGYLAAAASLICRETGEEPPVLQLLIYPVTEMDRVAMPEGPHDFDYPLSRADMLWFSEQYLATPADAHDPLCSIRRATSLSGLPPALVCLAGYDVLREEGEALAARLAADGVPVVLQVFDSLPHAFTAMCGAIPDARSATRQIAKLLREQFSKLNKRDG